MLIISVPRSHANDNVVSFGKGDVLIGEIVVWLGVGLGDDLRGSRPHQEAEKSISGFVEVASKEQTLIECGVGGAG